ncbi:MAG: hypothetical protein RIB46_16955 [Pseudomonadales bacterium]
MNRFGAFLVHLGISLIIFAGLAALVLFVWYPDFFFAADGGWEGIRIIILVDLVAGPLLTLIVYNRDKPSLRTDLAIIAVFQAACLTAGTYVVYSERPLALVYVDGRFTSMAADDYTAYGVDVPDLSHLPGIGPKQVAVEMPDDPEQQAEIRRYGIANRVPLRAMVDRYQPLTYAALRVEREAFDQDALRQRDAETGQIDVWLDTHGGELADYAFFPFATRYEYVFLGVSKAQEQIVGLLRTPAPL